MGRIGGGGGGRRGMNLRRAVVLRAGRMEGETAQVNELRVTVR
jgi:hypothetical protein